MYNMRSTTFYITYKSRFNYTLMILYMEQNQYLTFHISYKSYLRFCLTIISLLNLLSYTQYYASRPISLLSKPNYLKVEPQGNMASYLPWHVRCLKILLEFDSLLVKLYIFLSLISSTFLDLENFTSLKSAI